jgi:hypothetical protein
MGNCGSKFTGTFCDEILYEELGADSDIVGFGV